MTYGEIYDSVLYYTWGDVPPPQNAQPHLMRMITSAQRKIQRDYNFWFMLAHIVIPTVIDQISYLLDDRFKEIEFCNITTPSGAKTEPLQELDLSGDKELQLELSTASSEYPEYYMVDGSTIKLYPKPSAVKNLNVRLWKFLPALPTVYNDLRVYSDAISEYLAEAVIYHVLSDLKLTQDEWQSSQLWKQRYFEEIQQGQREDMHRRQNDTGRYKAI